MWRETPGEMKWNVCLFLFFFLSIFSPDSMQLVEHISRIFPDNRKLLESAFHIKRPSSKTFLSKDREVTTLSCRVFEKTSEEQRTCYQWNGDHNLFLFLELNVYTMSGKNLEGKLLSRSFCSAFFTSSLIILPCWFEFNSLCFLYHRGAPWEGHRNGSTFNAPFH